MRQRESVSSTLLLSWSGLGLASLPARDIAGGPGYLGRDTPQRSRHASQPRIFARCPTRCQEPRSAVLVDGLSLPTRQQRAAQAVGDVDSAPAARGHSTR